MTIPLFQKAIVIGLFHIQLDCYLIVCESGSKNALYFRFIRRALRRLVNGNFVFPITINSQPQAMIQLLLCSLLAMPRLCNYLCRWQWLSSALADSLQLYHHTQMYSEYILRLDWNHLTWCLYRLLYALHSELYLNKSLLFCHITIIIVIIIWLLCHTLCHTKHWEIIIINIFDIFWKVQIFSILYIPVMPIYWPTYYIMNALFRFFPYTSKHKCNSII